MMARLVKCLLAGAAAAAVMTADVLTAGRKALAAQAAAGHESTTAVVVTGSILSALLLGAAFFVIVSATAWARPAWLIRRPRAAIRSTPDADQGLPGQAGELPADHHAGPGHEDGSWH